ncbi:unnamed protein product [Owenia fusiformis]|uniref:Uncharacterized protein n=1 Tax=Owenia fusiformis TaxID=6347 RepID=A0A8J1UBZ5_OWEFU|nr:unnamed protein product [Owenia fusiformis]
MTSSVNLSNSDLIQASKTVPAYKDLQMKCLKCLTPSADVKTLRCLHGICVECFSGYLDAADYQQNGIQCFTMRCPICDEPTVVQPEGILALNTDFFNFDELSEKIAKRNPKPATPVKVEKEEKVEKNSQSESSVLPNPLDSKLFSMARKSLAGSLFTEATKPNDEDADTSKNLTPAESTETINKNKENINSENIQNNNNEHIKPSLKIPKSKTAKKVEFCRRHPKGIITHYCADCIVPVCAICCKKHHDEHNIKNLDTGLKPQRAKLETVQKLMNSKLVSIGHRVSELEHIHTNLCYSYTSTRAAIKQKTADMIRKLKEQEKNAIGELDNEYKPKIQVVQAERDNLGIHRTNMEALYNFTSDVLKGSPIDMLYVQKVLTSKLVKCTELQPPILSKKMPIGPIYLPYTEEISIGDVDIANLPMVFHIVPQSSPPEVSISPIAVVRLLCKPRSPELSTSLDMEPPTDKLNNGPYDIAFTSLGGIIIPNSENNGLTVYGNKGDILGHLAKEKVKPLRLATTQDGQILVTNTGKKETINMFTKNGMKIRQIGKGEFKAPCAVASLEKDRIICSDSEKCFVSIHNLTGDLIKKFGTQGSGPGQFNYPAYIAVDDRANHILVCDMYNHCIKVFSREGNFLFQIASEGEMDGQLRCPHAIALDKKSNVYVADCDNHRISVFSPYGRFIQHVMTYEHGLSYPYAVGVSPDNCLVVIGENNCWPTMWIYQLSHMEDETQC